MGIKAANNIFPHDPDDNWRLKLDRGGYQGSAQDLFDLINNVTAPDAIVVKGKIVKTLNQLSIEEGSFTCRINQQVITNSQPYTTIIDAAQDGYHRIDILVFTQNGTIVKIKGSEDLSEAQEPDTPDNTIKISFTSVFGSTIGDPEIPTDNNFISKFSKGLFQIGGFGIVETFDIDERSYLKILNGVTGLKSINIANSSSFYFGKSYTIKNATGVNITLYHNQGTGNFRFYFPNSQDYILNPNETITFIIRDINYSLGGGSLDYIGFMPTVIDISGKEDSVNKSNFVTDADSSIKFPTWSAITLWIREKLNAALSSKASPESSDVFIIADNSDSGKTKKMLFSNFLIWLQSFFQTKDDQIEISSSTTVQNSWNGKTILFTSNCTVTVPASLNNSIMFPFRTLSGVTVTWAITSPFTWETTPSPTSEKSVGHFMRRGSSNTIMLDF